MSMPLENSLEQMLSEAYFKKASPLPLEIMLIEEIERRRTLGIGLDEPIGAFLLLTKRKISPMHVAASEGYVDAIRILLASGAAADLLNANGETPLYLAAQGGHADAIRVLVKEGKVSPGTPRKDGNLPLYLAIEGGHLGAIRALLELGANPDQVHEDPRNTSLDMFPNLVKKNSAEVLLLLHSLGGKPRSMDELLAFARMHNLEPAVQAAILRGLPEPAPQKAEPTIAEPEISVEDLLAKWRNKIEVQIVVYGKYMRVTARYSAGTLATDLRTFFQSLFGRESKAEISRDGLLSPWAEYSPYNGHGRCWGVTPRAAVFDFWFQGGTCGNDELNAGMKAFLRPLGLQQPDDAPPPENVVDIARMGDEESLELLPFTSVPDIDTLSGCFSKLYHSLPQLEADQASDHILVSRGGIPPSAVRSRGQGMLGSLGWVVSSTSQSSNVQGPIGQVGFSTSDLRSDPSRGGPRR